MARGGAENRERYPTRLKTRLTVGLAAWRQTPAGKRLEKLIWAVQIWGPSAVFEEIAYVRDIYRNELVSFLELKAVLIENGMSLNDINDLVMVGHGKGCACWQCIGRLQAWIVRTRRAADDSDHNTGTENVGGEED